MSLRPLAERDRLVRENIKLAYWFARKTWRRASVTHGAGPQDLEDMESEAVVALIRAADTWDAAKGSKFSYYAGMVMRHHFSNTCIVPGSALTVPRNVFFVLRKFWTARRAVLAEDPSLDGEALFAAAIARSGQKEKLVRERLGILHQRAVSLDAPLSDETALTMLDTLVDANADHENSTQRLHLLRTLSAAMAAYLKTIEHRTRRAALWGWIVGESGVATAERLGVSKQAVQQARNLEIPRFREAMAREFGPDWQELLRP